MSRYASIASCVLLMMLALSAGRAPGAEVGRVTVVSVSGPAQKMNPTEPGSQWRALAEGDRLGELTLIRTGLKAKVVLKFADRGEVTISGPAKMGIGEFKKAEQATRTRLGLKYGTVRANVDHRRGPHDFKIATPVATLSVRGSKSDLSCFPDNPQGLKMQVQDGNWNSSSGSGSQNSGPGEQTDNQGTHNDQSNQDQNDTEQGDPFGQNDDEKNNQNSNGDGRGDWQSGGDGDGSGVGQSSVFEDTTESNGGGDPNYVGDLEPEPEWTPENDPNYMP